ncbi:MAG: tyrosine-protein phosphatase [Clostridia bacterium]|nr:tyrosine-protein phosphatase [Clostridia bacterium]
MNIELIKENVMKWMAEELTPGEGSNVYDTLSDELKKRSLNLKNVQNGRELGGYVTKDGKTVKKGKLLRTANLSKATEQDISKLEALDLKLILDLRSSMERQNFPDKEVPGAENVWANLVESSIGPEMEKTVRKLAPRLLKENPDMKKLTVKFVSDRGIQKYLRSYYLSIVKDMKTQKELTHCFSEILKKEGATVLWHCTQGKDRCGLMSLLMLGTLGVDDETILDDFSVSNEYYREFLDERLLVAKKMLAGRKTKEALISMIGVSREYMKEVVDYMNREYGSIAGYVKSVLKVSEDEISALKSYYLE